VQKPQFPVNPIARIPPISIADQTLQDISRSTIVGMAPMVLLERHLERAIERFQEQPTKLRGA